MSTVCLISPMICVSIYTVSTYSTRCAWTGLEIIATGKYLQDLLIPFYESSYPYETPSGPGRSSKFPDQSQSGSPSLPFSTAMNLSGRVSEVWFDLAWLGEVSIYHWLNALCFITRKAQKKHCTGQDTGSTLSRTQKSHPCMIARAIGPGAESHAALPPSGPFGISSCGAVRCWLHLPVAHLHLRLRLPAPPPP